MEDIKKTNIESEKKSWEITLENVLYKHFKTVYQFDDDSSSIAASFVIRQLPVIVNLIERTSKQLNNK